MTYEDRKIIQLQYNPAGKMFFALTDEPVKLVIDYDEAPVKWQEMADHADIGGAALGTLYLEPEEYTDAMKRNRRQNKKDGLV